jgi:hypothetical protein
MKQSQSSIIDARDDLDPESDFFSGLEWSLRILRPTSNASSDPLQIFPLCHSLLLKTLTGNPSSEDRGLQWLKVLV